MATTAAHSQHEPLHLLDITALAEHLSVDVRHVRRLVSERRIPFIKWGHLLRFDPAAIAVWIDENSSEPSPSRRSAS